MPNLRTAIFIDSDNANSSELLKVWPILCKIGDVFIARAFGDWESSGLQLIKKTCDDLGIECVQQNVYVTGKNATDMALTIEVLDVFHTEILEQVVIVSKDSDFTPLAHFLNARNVAVVGVGSDDVSWAFKRSCSLFIDPNAVDILSLSEHSQQTKREHIYNVLAVHIRAFHSKKEVFKLEEVAKILREIDPDFSSMSYGDYSLIDFLIKSDLFAKCDKSHDSLVFLDGATAKVEDDSSCVFKKPLKQLLEDSLSWPYFSGYMKIVEMVGYFKEHGVHVSSSDIQAYFSTNNSVGTFIHIPGGEAVVWLNAQRHTEQQLRCKELILRTIDFHIKSHGHALMMSYSRFKSIMKEIDPELTWGKYGAHDMNELIENSRDLLIPENIHGGRVLSLAGNHGVSLYQHLQSALSLMRSQLLHQKHQGNPWMDANEWQSLLKDVSVNFSLERYKVANMQCIWWIFSDQIAQDKTGVKSCRSQSCASFIQKTIVNAA